MSKFQAYIKDKPECFGYRRDLVPLEVPCDKCKHVAACLSVVREVFSAVRTEQLSANGYFPSELRELRRRHKNVCRLYSSDADQKFPIELIENFHNRVLPPRCHDDIESAREMEEFLPDDELFPSDSQLSEVISKPPVVIEEVENTSDAAVPKTPAAMKASMAITAPKIIATMTGAYQFPILKDSRYGRHTNDELIENLARLVVDGFHATPALGYEAIRDAFCAIHVEMNLRQQHAPRFRPTHRLPRKFDAGVEVTESRDRQVIDLHWRAHSTNKPVASANNYPTIFNNAPFDFAAAERFAQENWRSSAKAVHLHLTEEMQWENSIIQQPSIRNTWGIIDRGYVHGDSVKQPGAPQIEQKLREAVYRAKKPQVERSIPGMVDAWKARKIVGDGVANVAAMVASMTGKKQRDPRAMKRTLKSLDVYLGKPSRAKT